MNVREGANWLWLWLCVCVCVCVRDILCVKIQDRGMIGCVCVVFHSPPMSVRVRGGEIIIDEGPTCDRKQSGGLDNLVQDSSPNDLHRGYSDASSSGHDL